MEMKIMQPITGGGITLKNRIMFPPLTTGYEERDGSIGEQSRAFYTLSLIHISSSVLKAASSRRRNPRWGHGD